METLSPQVLSRSLRDVPFDQKWELLKPTIERLYIRENWKLSDVIKTIKDQHGFDAAEPQYKYQIKKWKLRKNTSTLKKAALYQIVQKRAQLGKPSVVTRNGQIVDTKNLRRYLKTEARREITLQPMAGGAAKDANSLSGHASLFGNRIFMNWNMSYGAIRSSASRVADYASPLSDIVVTTPSSPNAAPSPTTVAVRAMTPIARARLFVEGRHNDLLKSMENKQVVVMSTWMYQFWLFSFKTAKHWGRGPQDWTAGILGFDDYRQRTTISISSPNTPGMGVDIPASQSIPREDEVIDAPMSSDEKRPSSLCRWSIHQAYSSKCFPPDCLNLEDEESWPTWPASHDSKKFTEKLSDGLESNSFSNVGLNDLPIAVDQIVKAARRSPIELLKEALGFSIMSRNVELMSQLIEQLEGDLEFSDLSGLYPFHLAVTYLDGSKTCCNVLDALVDMRPLSLHNLYINDLGHTILDHLMIAILKAHTSCLPSVVDVIFRKEKRFRGEDVDICGRWDADSDCIRALLASGTSGIPFGWKHMFCHTSVQTICHCIGTIFWPHWGPNINAPSGLFMRRCLHCGVKLQILPLHTLVLVGLHLSQSGCKDETLFGILACLLCLLSYGANPLLKADISLEALLGSEEVNECSHEELDPAELAEKVPASFTLTWSRELRTGWQVVCNVLKHSQAEWKVRHSHLPTKCPEDDARYNFFGGSKILPSLWAAVQTELLTYRRLDEGDAWNSQNFNMDALNESLQSGGKVAIALVQDEMMKPFCSCGGFSAAAPAYALVDEAAAYYFSNLEDWDRTTYIHTPVDRGELWSSND